jgi:class 3 adenylate cyclase
MESEDLRARLAALLPRTLWPLVQAGGGSERAQGCVLFADIAGFTPLTGSLARIGKEGAEELTRILNDFFTAMIAIVHSEGGDVLRFGGDAMTLFFPSGPEAGLGAALRMQEETARFQAIRTIPPAGTTSPPGAPSTPPRRRNTARRRARSS